MNTPVILGNVTVSVLKVGLQCSGLGETTCDGPLHLGNDLGGGGRRGPEGVGPWTIWSINRCLNG